MNKRQTSINIPVTQTHFDRTMEELGRIIKSGFDQVTGQFGHVDNEFAKVDNEFAQLHKEIAGLDSRLGNVELRLGEAAYRFELVELEQRVDVLEKHTGLHKK